MTAVAMPKRRERWSPTRGRGMVLDADLAEWHRRHPRVAVDPRLAAWAGDWEENALLDEGEADILNVWLLQTSALTKYLALMISTALAETDTMAILSTKEVFAPPLNGYARQQILSTDWAAPTLNAGDYQTTAAQKTFGPSATSAWASLTGVSLVTAATGQIAGSGKMLIYLALSGTTTVNIGQSFLYQLTNKAA